MGSDAGGAAASGFVVRDARLEDLPTIVEIYNATIPGRMVTAELNPVSVESRHAWFLEHQPARRPMWVLEHAEGPGQGVCGWLSLSDFNRRPAYGATAEVSIYLHSAVRGRGQGRALLARAIRHAPELGVNTLIGLIFGHNTPSLELFKGEGFERWGFLPRVARLDGQERDLVIVGRRVA